MFSSPSTTAEDAQKRTAAYVAMHREAAAEFFAYEKTSGQAIGIAGIKELKPDYWTVTDITIGPAFLGKGYGKQILTVLRDLAFKKCGAVELAYDCFAENKGSKQLALSCRFVFSYSKKADLRKNGRNRHI